MASRKSRRKSRNGARIAPDRPYPAKKSLTAKDSAGRLVSAQTGEWLYVFKRAVGETTVYLKLVLRTHCVVVSFHEEESGDHED